MEGFIGNKDNSKLLRVYLLRNCYEICKGLEKDSPYQSFCIIIRKEQIKNDTQFGYKEELKVWKLKKINFVYLPNLNDLITFLWAHVSLDKPLSTGIFIDGLEQYFGEGFNFEQNGQAIGVFMNLLQKLSEKSLGKRGRMKVGFSLTYNSYIFPRNEYINYMNKFSCNVWEVIGQEVTKNGEEYESDYTKNFFQIYGSALVKAQEN